MEQQIVKELAGAIGHYDNVRAPGPEFIGKPIVIIAALLTCKSPNCQVNAFIVVG